jgi:uncharacterized protein YkwD
MGRHRRSAAGRAARGRATEVAPAHEAIPEHYGPENLYGFAAVLEDETSPGRRSHRKQKKTVTRVKTGLLGASAAVALGAAAVAIGVLPGGDKGTVDSADTGIPAGSSPPGLAIQQGGAAGTANREDESTSRDTERSASPPTSRSKTAAPSTTPPRKPSTKEPGSKKTQKGTHAGKDRKGSEKGSAGLPAEEAAEAEVLRLVNVEREEAGCSPVAANSSLAKLAGAFSDDMARRGFFDHTDPEGDTPWDRAAAMGITDLGGENIARGQTTAAAVMDAWMSSPGHRANILNCDFRTLGVGTTRGSVGPWWTQDFGY